MLTCLLDLTGFVGRYLSNAKFKDFQLWGFWGWFFVWFCFSNPANFCESYSQLALVHLRTH